MPLMVTGCVACCPGFSVRVPDDGMMPIPAGAVTAHRTVCGRWITLWAPTRTVVGAPRAAVVALHGVVKPIAGASPWL